MKYFFIWLNIKFFNFSDIYSTPRLAESLENVVSMSSVSGNNSVLTSSSINLNGLGQRYPRIDSVSSLNSSPNHNLETIENSIPSSKGDGVDGSGNGGGGGGGRQGKWKIFSK